MGVIDMDTNDPAYIEWQAWQLVCSRFRSLVGDINDEQFNPLVQAIEAWGELLHEFRSTQDETTVKEVRMQRLAAAL